MMACWIIPMDPGQLPSYWTNSGALALVDFLRHLPHELVVDADVVERFAQAVQDAEGRATDDRTRGPEDSAPTTTPSAPPRAAPFAPPRSIV